jgi:hypothetical protein
MAGIKLKGLDRGINGADPYDEIGVGDAVPGSVNCIYCDGMIQTPDGFKVITQHGLPLVSGEEILAVFKYTEQDRTEHLIAMTRTKVFRKDSTEDTWVELEKGSGSIPQEWSLTANVDHPVSWATMDSTDGALLDVNGPERAYRHLLMSDGGQTSVKRWAGKYEVKRWPLLGGNGYHIDDPDPADASKIHYARQVLVFQNHVFLVNTREYDENGILRETFSRLRWGMAGKLEKDLLDESAYDYTKVGAGFRDLVNTGDQNEWAMPLGNNLIVYQKRTIWTGVSMPNSSDAFSFDVTVEGRGLLSARLLASDGTRHFFIGSDHVLYAYYGGQQFTVLEGRIGEELRKAIDFTNAHRCFMCLGANYRRLWIFVIGADDAFSVKAFGVDLRSNSWQVRDYSGAFAAGKGITSANLIGNQAYMTGASYQDLLDDTDNEQYSYGITVPPDAGEWEGTVGKTKHGDEYDTLTNTSAKWKTAGDGLVRVGDWINFSNGSSARNCVPGDYAIETVNSDTSITIVGRFDDGTHTPTPVWGDYTIWHIPTGNGYRYFDELFEIMANDMLVIGSSDGYIFQNDPDLATDNGEELTAVHLTKVFDFDEPDQLKFWPGLVIKAKGESITVSYRISDFDTADDGWQDFETQDLTDMFRDYTFDIHQESTAIQFKFSSTEKFRVSKAFIMQPTLEGIV